MFFKCPPYGSGEKKREGKEKKNVLIAGQSELKVTVIFALLILVQFQKKNLAPLPLKRFEEMRVCTWKPLLLSPIPTEETTYYPLFRAQAWDSGDQSSVVTATDVLGVTWQAI